MTPAAAKRLIPAAVLLPAPGVGANGLEPARHTPAEDLLGAGGIGVVRRDVARPRLTNPKVHEASMKKLDTLMV
jgi:hypothetical protein